MSEHIIETARPVYGPGSSHNMIADLLSRAQGGNDGDEARSRLAAAGALEAERRNAANLTISTSHGGSDFGGPSAAAHFNEAFTDQATKAIVIAPLFSAEPLRPGVGEILKVPTISASVTPTAQTDSQAVATANPTTSYVNVPVAMVSALLTCSRQFADLVLAPGGEALAAEVLGRRYAEAVDLQLACGTGATGQTVGLDHTTSPTAGAYTQATPDVPTFITNLMKLRSQVHTARGGSTDVCLMHPSKSSWYYDGGASTDVGFNAIERSGLKIVEYAGLPVTLGAGTETEVMLLRTADLRYWRSEPVIDVAEDYSGVTTGQLAIAVHGYVASPGANLNPKGLGLLTGTGLKAVTGF